MSMRAILLLQEILNYIANNVIKLNKMKKQTKKWIPKQGDYFVWEDDGLNHICIAGWETTYTIEYLVELIGENNLYHSNGVHRDAPMRAATAYEMAILNDKLAERRLWFDKERCELVKIPAIPEFLLNNKNL